MGYHYYGGSEQAAILGYLLAFISIFMLILAVYAVISYIFSSIAYYQISKRRGYQKPWLAWIPFAREYLVGAIADDINIKCGKKTYFGWIYLGLSVLSSTSTMAVLRDLQRLSTGYGFSVGSPMTSLAGLAATIVYFLILYRIYKDYIPTQTTLMMVLSVIFSFITPFVLFAIRNRPSISCGQYGYQGPGGYNGYGGYGGYNGNQGYYGGNGPQQF